MLNIIALLFALSANQLPADARYVPVSEGASGLGLVNADIQWTGDIARVHVVVVYGGDSEGPAMVGSAIEEIDCARRTHRLLEYAGYGERLELKVNPVFPPERFEPATPGSHFERTINYVCARAPQQPLAAPLATVAAEFWGRYGKPKITE